MRHLRKHTVWLVALLAVAMLAVAACGAGGDTADDPGGDTGEPADETDEDTADEGDSGDEDDEGDDEAMAEPIKIGIIQDQSGVLENYGTESLRGFELGLEYITDGTGEVLGRPIELIIEDDASDPEQGLQLAEKLVQDDEVDILQGTSSSGVAQAINGVAEENEVLFMVDPAAADSITGEAWNRYVFRTGSNVSQDALAGGVYAANNLGESFIHLAPDYTWGHDSAAAWNEIIADNGGEIVDPVFAPQDAADFSPYIQQVLDSGADTLVVSWSGSGAVQLFQQLNTNAVQEQMNVTTGFGDIPALRAIGFEGGTGLIGMTKYYYQLPDNDVNDWFVDRYMEEYDSEPDIFTPGGFSAAVAIVEGIRAAESTDAEALIPVLEDMSFETPKGTMTFRPEDHQALQTMYIAELTEMEDFDYPVPQLVDTMSPEQTAPPIRNEAGD